MAEETSGDSDEDVLAEGREFMRLSIDADSDNRQDALDDMNFVVGDQWDLLDRQGRELDGRPCLTVNKLVTYLHQVTNQQRQNKPAIKVHPVDDGADMDTAEVIQGMTRHIEYASNADVAYDTAVNCAAAGGFGYFRLVTEYCNERSFDQDIKFKRVRNPFTVYFDPFSIEPDGSDARRVMLSEQVPREVFVQEHGESKAADPSNIERGPGDGTMLWTTHDAIRVAEYYRVETKKATLCMLSTGQTAFEDEIPQEMRALVVNKRPSEKRVVMWYKLTGQDVLDKREIPCRWIPVFPVYGDEWDVDGRVHRSGIIRFAKDPQRMYNYWMTAATEQVALIPKAPYIGAAGAFENFEEYWDQANRRSFPRLEYNPVSLDGVLAPAPQRQPMADIPVGMLQMALHANDNIKGTTGLFDSSLGARGNATSGVQERQQQIQGDVANFHYSDNLTRAIRHAGRCIIDMLPRVYDTPRVVRILGEDDVASFAKVNQPMEQPEVDEKTGAVRRVLNDLTVGQYDVTVTVGPSYTTKRQEAVEGMVQVAQAWPKLMEIAGDKVIRNMDWPGAEEIAERIKRTLPANITDEEDSEIPPQVKGQMDQMMQVIQALQGHVKAQEQQLADKNAELQLKRYQIDAETERNTQDNTKDLIVEQMKLTLQPIEQMLPRIATIEAALGNIADFVIPAVQEMAEGPPGAPALAPTQPAPAGFFPPEGTPQ